jgi:hypothetical protein
MLPLITFESIDRILLHSVLTTCHCRPPKVCTFFSPCHQVYQHGRYANFWGGRILVPLNVWFFKHMLFLWRWFMCKTWNINIDRSNWSALSDLSNFEKYSLIRHVYTSIKFVRNQFLFVKEHVNIEFWLERLKERCDVGDLDLGSKVVASRILKQMKVSGQFLARKQTLSPNEKDSGCPWAVLDVVANRKIFAPIRNRTSVIQPNVKLTKLFRLVT